MECHRMRVLAEYKKNPAPKIAAVIKRKRALREADLGKARKIASDTSRAWRMANPERDKINRALWYSKNATRRLAQARARYALNPTKGRADIRRWRKENPEKARASFRAWCAANPDKTRVRGRNRRARKRKAEGRHTAADIARIRADQKDRCMICAIDLDGGGHVDHVIPLARGGSNWPENLQLLCAHCNCSKGAKLPHQLASREQELGV